MVSCFWYKIRNDLRILTARLSDFQMCIYIYKQAHGLIGFFTKATTPTAWDASYLIMISVEFLGAEEETFRYLRKTRAIRSKRFKRSS